MKERNRTALLYLILIITIWSLQFAHASNPHGSHGSQGSHGSTQMNTTHAPGVTHGHNSTGHGHGHGQHKEIHVFVVMFDNVSQPFTVCVWILLASLAKVGFHYFENISATLPESCLLILLGIPIGLVLENLGIEGHNFLTSTLFFNYLLPPIIFDAGYFINSDLFFANIGTILLYAIIGTIFNTFVVGASMFGIQTTCGVTITLLQSFVFGSLISAVDPVAVLTVFEEVQVNEGLYMLVFGESVLNDAASVVLYRTFQNLPDAVDAKQVGLAIASFFVVSIFGTLIGVIYGFITGFITRFTDHVRVIEPLFVFALAYMAYLTAEMFHFSGIMSILFAGVVMKPYVESNVGAKSYVTIKYFLKLMSSSCESVIFMLLGVALVQYKHEFNIKFIAWCVFFISLFRTVGVVALTYLANKWRLEKVSKVEQFIMSYGGLRGAVAFCLVILVAAGDDAESIRLKKLLVTTTLAVIVFTCFFQGGTINFFIEKLKVEKAEERETSMMEKLNSKVMNHMVGGVESIAGSKGYGFWRTAFHHFNMKYLRPILLRHPDKHQDDGLFAGHKHRQFKLSLAESPDKIANGNGPTKESDQNQTKEGMTSNHQPISGSDNKGFNPDYISPMRNTDSYNNPVYSARSSYYTREIEQSGGYHPATLHSLHIVPSFMGMGNNNQFDDLDIFSETKKVHRRRKYTDARVGIPGFSEDDRRRLYEQGSHQQQWRQGPTTYRDGNQPQVRERRRSRDHYGNNSAPVRRSSRDHGSAPVRRSSRDYGDGGQPVRRSSRDHGSAPVRRSSRDHGSDQPVRRSSRDHGSDQPVRRSSRDYGSDQPVRRSSRDYGNEHEQQQPVRRSSRDMSNEPQRRSSRDFIGVPDRRPSRDVGAEPLSVIMAREGDESHKEVAAKINAIIEEDEEEDNAIEMDSIKTEGLPLWMKQTMSGNNEALAEASDSSSEQKSDESQKSRSNERRRTTSSGSRSSKKSKSHSIVEIENPWGREDDDHGPIRDVPQATFQNSH